jgi:hypothetical protein
VVVSKGFQEPLLNRLFLRRGTVRQGGGLFHELDHRGVVDEAIEDAAEKVKTKTKGYRHG